MTEAAHLRLTRADYDSVADVYADRFRSDFADRPLDRALLAAFAELVRAGGGGPVADLGCGPGHITEQLHTLGLAAFGVDLSPRMVTLARDAYPHLRFEEGTLTAPDLADGVLGGIVAWFSLIHLPPAQVPAVCAEFDRVLAPGGHVLLALQAADDDARSPQAFDHAVAPAYRWSPDHLAGLLARAGFVEVARMLRRPGESERFPQASLLARKPAGGPG